MNARIEQLDQASTHHKATPPDSGFIDIGFIKPRKRGLVAGCEPDGQSYLTELLEESSHDPLEYNRQPIGKLTWCLHHPVLLNLLHALFTLASAKYYQAHRISRFAQPMTLHLPRLQQEGNRIHPENQTSC